MIERLIGLPMPWRATGTFAIGGLHAVGFTPAQNTDYLLVVSASGRGVFDLRAGARVARDYDDDAYDEVTETVLGIGPLAGVCVEVCGNGRAISTRRALPLTTHDGWSAMSTAAPGRTVGSIVLRPPGPQTEIPIASVEEVRALGFSPTGRSLVVAEPHTLHVWRR